MTDTATTAAGLADPTLANTVVPYLVVDGAAAAIDFYVRAFGAIEQHRLVGDDGRVGHAEITIGSSRLNLADEYPEADAIAPTTRGGTSTSFTIEVADVDRAFATALEMGATSLREVADQFYGMRQGSLRDPWGHRWSLSQMIAGFGDEQYLANSAELGFEVLNADPSTPTVHNPALPVATTAAAADPQVKHHVSGDLYYFTLPVPDLARGQRFFSAVLGWQFVDPDNGHVGNITAPPGGLNVTDEAGARLWFVVDDIHTAVARVRAAGGTAQDPVLYESGWSSDCVDDQGTVFSLSVPSDAYSG